MNIDMLFVHEQISSDLYQAYKGDRSSQLYYNTSHTLYKYLYIIINV